MRWLHDPLLEAAGKVDASGPADLLRRALRGGADRMRAMGSGRGQGFASAAEFREWFAEAGR